jgi:hypothetical protein
MEKSVKYKAYREKRNLMNGKSLRYSGRDAARKSNPTVPAAGSEGPTQKPREGSPDQTPSSAHCKPDVTPGLRWICRLDCTRSAGFAQTTLSPAFGDVKYCAT